jgi:anthranilate synthase
MSTDSYRTAGGITIHRTVSGCDAATAVDELIDRLDACRGALFSSSYEFPGRYTRWDMGFTAPPVVLTTLGSTFRIEALNERGTLLLPTLVGAIEATEGIAALDRRADAVDGRIVAPGRRFDEEERSRQPSVFSVVRCLVDLFRSPDDPNLGLYGAFGYDLAFQFEPIPLRLARPDDQRDLVLYLPDELLIVDHQRESAEIRSYDFTLPDRRTTLGMPRTIDLQPFEPDLHTPASRDHEEGGYAQVVGVAKEFFARGDLFEVVPGQTFTDPCPHLPSELFRRLRVANPSPYGFLINLGPASPQAMSPEYLVGASPEMYVRVDGARVETCPISGTIARGGDPISDAAQILALLNSEKDASELTMCTDVDRNDKSRICVPGSVRVIGRRQIELYSRLIHTVDHVEGQLRPGFDAIDAFLAHTWAVTVTGAPKTAAMMFLERHEASPRAWYGGAVGLVGFDGNMNTGLTLRTIRVKDGRASVRVGATLLWDSVPADEEAETELKASVFLDTVRGRTGTVRTAAPAPAPSGPPRRILLVDHLDSFVHTLASYFRTTGAEVRTLRAPLQPAEVAGSGADLVVLSPGPGRPDDFELRATLAQITSAGLAAFGVCLGLQGMVEYFGGTLGQLDVPMHGRASTVKVVGGRLFEGLPESFTVGRYHSLYALPEALPDCLEVTAISDDGIIMAVEHRTLPLAAVQFHPESIMTLDGDVGARLVANVARLLGR